MVEKKKKMNSELSGQTNPNEISSKKFENRSFNSASKTNYYFYSNRDASENP